MYFIYIVRSLETLRTIGEIASLETSENFGTLGQLGLNFCPCFVLFLIFSFLDFNRFLFLSGKKKEGNTFRILSTNIEFHLDIVQIERNKFFNGLLPSSLSLAHFILSTFPIPFYQPPTRIPYRKKRNKTFLFQSFPLHSAKFLNRPTISPPLSLSIYTCRQPKRRCYPADKKKLRRGFLDPKPPPSTFVVRLFILYTSYNQQKRFPATDKLYLLAV